jgi:gluconolactonase
VFETSLDDYAEIWVNGELTRYAGQSGGSVIAGWNAPNSLVVGRNLYATVLLGSSKAGGTNAG